MDIAKRLNTLVFEITGGNGKKFAEKTGVNQTTFHNYLKGRLPKADALESICKVYNVNLNWLVAGIGPKYLTEEKITSRKYIALLDEWLNELAKDDPRNEIWFEKEIEKKVPEFKEWLNAKESEGNKGEFVRSRDGETVT